MKVKAKIDAPPCRLPAALFGVDWNLETERGDTKKVPARYYGMYKTHSHLFTIPSPPRRLTIWISLRRQRLVWFIQRRYPELIFAILIVSFILAVFSVAP